MAEPTTSESGEEQVGSQCCGTVRRPSPVKVTDAESRVRSEPEVQRMAFGEVKRQRLEVVLSN